MKNENLSDQINYNPDNLLASIIGKLNLKNDAALSRALEVAPPVISKIRHRRLPVGASLLIRMHEVTDLSIQELRSLMGDRRNKFRISDKQFKPKASWIERNLKQGNLFLECISLSQQAGAFYFNATLVSNLLWQADKPQP